MDVVREKIRGIIAVELQVQESTIVPEASLSKLGMDSISALNVLFAVEEAFNLESIDVNEITNIKTVRDIEDVIQRHVAAS